MAVITQELMKKAAEWLMQDEHFLHVARALTGTVTFKDDEGRGYISFYNGKVIEAKEGTNVYGSEFYITATNENWNRAFHSNPRYGIYELDGDLIAFEGNMYVFAGNALAFYELWQTLRKAYFELNG